jgi:hypothetical protein
MEPDDLPGLTRGCCIWIWVDLATGAFTICDRPLPVARDAIIDLRALFAFDKYQAVVFTYLIIFAKEFMPLIADLIAIGSAVLFLYTTIAIVQFVLY